MSVACSIFQASEVFEEQRQVVDRRASNAESKESEEAEDIQKRGSSENQNTISVMAPALRMIELCPVPTSCAIWLGIIETPRRVGVIGFARGILGGFSAARKGLEEAFLESKKFDI